MTYLDNAATTFPKPEEVYSAMDSAARNNAVNAGRGSYSKAKEANALIVETKKKIRKLTNIEIDCPVVFSPSVTIAINQIANGMNISRGANVYVSPYEHNAVARCLRFLSERNGFQVKQIPIDDSTLEIDLDKLRYEFSKNKPTAVFCTHVSNVTGYILPVKEVFEESKKQGAVTVLDSAQSLGLLQVDAMSLNADIIAFAGHKTLYGPLGIGGFVNPGHIKLLPYVIGGTGSDSLNLEMPDDEEGRYEAASFNIVAIAGLNAALSVLEPTKNREKEVELSDYLIRGLKKNNKIRVFDYGDTKKQTGIVSFVVDGYSSTDIGVILDEDFDIAVRTGYHCAPYIHEYLGDIKYSGTVRVGLGEFNTIEDIDCLLEALGEILNE